MNETTQLISTIKRQLKSQGITYRDVAKVLEISEPSIKRMFSSGTFSLNRLVQVCNMLGFTVAELARDAQVNQYKLNTLTEKQERDIVANSNLLVITVLVINHWTLRDIVDHYKFTEAECIKYLLQLVALRIIDLLPGNRIRLNVTRDFQWLPNGSIQQYFDNTGLNDFLQGGFAQDNETFTFIHGMFTEQTLMQARDELKNLRQKFSQLHEASLDAPMAKRYGAGMLMALRKWEPEILIKLKR